MNRNVTFLLYCKLRKRNFGQDRVQDFKDMSRLYTFQRKILYTSLVKNRCINIIQEIVVFEEHNFSLSFLYLF